MARIEEDFETVRQALMDRYGYAAPGDDPWDALSRIEAAFVGDYVRELQQERDTLKAEVKNLKFVKDANVEAKQELLEEVERLREMLANSDTDNDETNAENRQLRAEVERLRAELTKEMNEVGRLTAELEDYKQAASAEAQIADEFKAERDALKEELEIRKDQRDALIDLNDCLIAERDEARRERDALKAALEEIAVYQPGARFIGEHAFTLKQIARQALTEPEEK
jgi:chromosome segregation ATPase